MLRPRPCCGRFTAFPHPWLDFCGVREKGEKMWERNGGERGKGKGENGTRPSLGKLDALAG